MLWKRRHVGGWRRLNEDLAVKQVLPVVVTECTDGGDLGEGRCLCGVEGNERRGRFGVVVDGGFDGLERWKVRRLQLYGDGYGNDGFSCG